MATSVARPRQSDPVRSLDHVRPTAAKAALPASGPSFRAVVSKAILAHYGSVKCAAFSLGQVDESLMQREFAAGKFGRFDEHADPAAKAYVAGVLHHAYGPSDPRARAHRLINQTRAMLDELAEVI